MQEGKFMASGQIVTTEQMQSLEREALKQGVTNEDLMESAGLAVAQECWMAMGTMEGRPVLVICGPGTNGSDALIAARHLHGYGASVFVYLTGPRDQSDRSWAAVEELGIPFAVANADGEFEELEVLLERATMVLDGIFGIGFDTTKRPIDGIYAEILNRLQAAAAAVPPVRVIAVDISSGLNSDTGEADVCAVPAEMTVTFGFSKVGHYVGDGRKYSGRTVEVDIGIPGPAIESVDIPYQSLRLHDLRRALPTRPNDGHKGTFGRLLVIAGSRNYPGAARLAIEAAARTGVGSVTLAAPESIQSLLVSLPDISHLPTFDVDGYLGGEAAAKGLLNELRTRSFKSILLGSGIGNNEDTVDFVRIFLSGLDEVVSVDFQGVVIDADGLNALARIEDWRSLTRQVVIITPHLGEMATLTGLEVDYIRQNKLKVAADYAQRSKSTVVLKGPGTVISNINGEARLSDTASSALSHGGTGDVLAGITGGFLAQQINSYDAASAAVYMHAEAARQVSEVYGDAATLASDIVRALPEARKVLDPPTANI